MENARHAHVISRWLRRLHIQACCRRCWLASFCLRRWIQPFGVGGNGFLVSVWFRARFGGAYGPAATRTMLSHTIKTNLSQHPRPIQYPRPILTKTKTGARHTTPLWHLRFQRWPSPCISSPEGLSPFPRWPKSWAARFRSCSGVWTTRGLGWPGLPFGHSSGERRFDPRVRLGSVTADLQA